MKRAIYALFLMLLLPWSSANGQQVTIEKLTFGEYTTGRVESYDDPKSPTGKRYASTGEALTAQTNTITLRPNMNFGFEYIVRGPSGNIELETVYFLPDESGRTITDATPAYVYKVPMTNGERNRMFWFIGKDASGMKTGNYVFQLRHQNRVVAEHTFKVQR